MNGKDRLEFAAKRSGEWQVSPDVVDKMIRFQEFVNIAGEDLMVQVTYSGYTVKSAKLWDFVARDEHHYHHDGVTYQKLTSHDRDKAARIEDVLLGNSRRF